MTSQYGVSDRSLLAPEDAYLSRPSLDSSKAGAVGNAAGLSVAAALRSRDRRRGRSRSSRRKGTWKKLLWVKQSYPDNYTDEETFLDALQWNPRLRPYEFWPLFADSTVIVQQVCTMILFVCCFTGIFQERVSSVTVVGWGSACTVLCWVLWDIWVGMEEASNAAAAVKEGSENLENGKAESSADVGPNSGVNPRDTQGPGAKQSPAGATERNHSEQSSSQSLRNGTLSKLHGKASSQFTGSSTGGVTAAEQFSTNSLRNEQRIVTAKSTVLICGALLGLSPILKSLTQSTASDSIWAISFWLMIINVIFFDYGGGIGATFPASLSTNAALMASTVLASRLPSTSQVFSLTLFSIQVFGLFPIFRRHLRHISWTGHAALTWLLVMGAGAGVALSLSGGGWAAAIAGVVLGSLLTGFAMGMCTWWLIGLQRYKNEIHGPWDPARPVIRRWDR